MPKPTGLDEPKTERFNMFLSPGELEAIGEWAWTNRIRSKSDALRRLAALALVLDAQADDLIEDLKSLLRGQEIGINALLEELAASGVDHGVALKALTVVGEWAERQTALALRLHPVLALVAAMRSSGTTAEALDNVERLLKNSEESLSEFASAISMNGDNAK